MSDRTSSARPLSSCALYAMLALLLLSFCATGAQAQGRGFGMGRSLPTGPITASIDVSQTGAPINPYLYGYFLENLGTMWYGGLWAEMLTDRKFYYPITAETQTAGRPGGGRFGFFGERWHPLGPGTRVVMDAEHAYAGSHSPSVALDAGTARGIQQSGLPLEQGKAYTGHVVLSADRGSRVQVSLVWGSGAGDRQTVTIRSPSAAYKSFPFSFQAGADTEDGRLEISATGTGTMHIGAVSLMPADNVEGFRPDLIAELKKVRPTYIRWGGNFSSGFDWHDAIGDRDKRPPRFDHAWGRVVQNDMGTFEVIELCKLLGAELDIGINAGFGDANSAAEWVEYVNGSQDTYWGHRRAEDGHPAPFGITWWGIGNEMYGQWQLGHMAIDDYVIKHNMIADKIKQVDPNVKIVASGATIFETGTTARHHRRPLPSTRPYAYGSPEDWSGQLLEHSAKNLDWISEHIYAVPDQAFDEGIQEFWPTYDPVQDQLRRIPNRVKGAVEAWQEYHKRMPYLDTMDIHMALDEWSAGGVRGGPGEMLGALAVAMTMNEMFRYSGVWQMSAYTGLTSVVAYDRTLAKPELRANGRLFELYHDHLGTIPVHVGGSSPQPELRGTVGVDKPSESSGSPTYPLDVAATLSADRKTLSVSVSNPSASDMSLRLDVHGGTPSRAGKVWTLSQKDPNARTMPGGPPAATVVSSSVSDSGAVLTIPAFTIRLYQFQLQ